MKIGAMNATMFEHDRYVEMLESAKRGEVMVAEVFAAMRNEVITEEQCKEILSAFERARVAPWQRLIITST